MGYTHHIIPIHFLHLWQFLSHSLTLSTAHSFNPHSFNPSLLQPHTPSTPHFQPHTPSLPHSFNPSSLTPHFQPLTLSTPHSFNPSVSYPLSLTTSPLTPSFPCSLEVMSAILKLSLLLSMWLHKKDTVMLWGEEETNTHTQTFQQSLYLCPPAFAMCISNTRNLSPEANWETVLSIAELLF